MFLRGQYLDVLLPMVVLRRLDALLEPTKDEVEEELQEQKEAELEDLEEDAIKDITGLSVILKPAVLTKPTQKSRKGNNIMVHYPIILISC